MTWDMGHPAGREPGALIRDLGHSVGVGAGTPAPREALFNYKSYSISCHRRIFFSFASEDRNNKNKYPRIEMQNFGGTVWRTLERTTKTSGKS